MAASVFDRLALIRLRRTELQEQVSTPAELHRIRKADLEEIRKLPRPPVMVRRCLEVVWALLHVNAANSSLQRLKGPGFLEFDWRRIQAMLANFESFFRAMEGYDIEPLIALPALAEHISGTYFGEGGLAEDEVRRSSVACASLFRWATTTTLRVHAALALAEVERELAELEASLPEEPQEPEPEEPEPVAPAQVEAPPAAPPQWCVQCDAGWRDFGADLNALLCEAHALGSKVRYDRGGFHYEAEPARGLQVNLETGTRRKIRLAP